jgi:DnaK suppressor protein
MATVMRSSAKKKSAPANDDAAAIAVDGPPLDPDAPFMGESHQRYFKSKLLAWKAGLLEDVNGTREQLREGPIREPDATDRASSETDWSIELRRRDRQRKLVSKIDAALRRLETGEYGYCLVTGEPIALARLDARPIATMTVEAQERHERNEKLTRED